jgi:hypothetical protein
MSGLSTLVHAPLSYKRGGMQRYNTSSRRQNLDRDSQLSSFHSNPTHSGVGYYAPAARTTLNPRVFMCSVINSGINSVISVLVLCSDTNIQIYFGSLH